MTSGKFDRPEFHLLPKDDPARAVQILRAAAGLDPLQPGPDQPETDGAEPDPV